MTPSFPGLAQPGSFFIIPSYPLSTKKYFLLLTPPRRISDLIEDFEWTRLYQGYCGGEDQADGEASLPTHRSLLSRAGDILRRHQDRPLCPDGLSAQPRPDQPDQHGHHPGRRSQTGHKIYYYIVEILSVLSSCHNDTAKGQKCP